MVNDDQFNPVRTDLAVEAKDMYGKEEGQSEGITVRDVKKDGIKISYVKINDEGARKTGKKRGHYVTIYADGVKKQDTASQEAAAKILASELENILKLNHIHKNDKGLIVGLGNWHVTPDALGPMTVEKVLVTNHLFELEFETVAKGYRPVAAVTPGVMGVTGIETSEIIAGIIEQYKPEFVIAIDALASRSIDRINETIQISDTGIHPGSGVGNKRKELSKHTFGIPVIAIGVPTVVDAVTITSDTIDYLLKHFGRTWKEKDRPFQSLLPGGFTFGKQELNDTDLPNLEKRQTFLGMVGTLSEEDKRSLISEVLSPLGKNMIVTPKEVDDFMKNMAHVLASGINAALHETIDVDNLSAYTR
ncbi:spore protease [Cerasibacillus quisquiliarum]|uniref:Germination protease n=1 Tax=Cerasibacillus quisquiliarum TaxID=227865 RepID=A0A511UWP1_9BACI|nr:GPR endopeptidase [Cerasibacillus quisquiliarum]MBB5145558.1 spore protease [Cerasibacillus quisquiliarum]GEN31046.1 germination protease [Cerasibacillus quisquiliarum]